MHLLFAAALLTHWLLASDLHVEPGPSAPVPAAYEHDANWSLFDSSVAAMRKADPNAPVVILAGDFLAHHFPKNNALALQTMARIARTFNGAFPRAQFIIVPGNNDDPCGDYRDTPGTSYFGKLARIWAPLVNRNGAAPHFERDFGRYGWYSARLPIAHMRVLALDSVYWSIVYRRCANIHPNAPRAQMQWLKTMLSAPAARKTLLVMHIPPGVDANSTLLAHRFLVVPFWDAATSATFVRLTNAHAQIIPFAIAGHVHRDGFRLFGVLPVLVAPSISPVYSNNPAFLRLDVASDGTLRDYDLYDFDEAAQTWTSGVSYDRYFGLASFNAQALANLHARLARDPQLRAKWSAIEVAFSPKRDIGEGNWRVYWCAQTQLAGTFAACDGVQNRVAVVPVAAAIAGIVVIFGVIALTLRLARARRRA